MNIRNAACWLVAAALLIAAPAEAATVKYDYDRDLDFSKWTHVAWTTPERPGASLAERRFRRAIEAEFAAKGYVLVAERSKADFLIACRAAAWQDVSLADTWHGPAFGRSLSVYREVKGALTLDVYERSSGSLAWRGVVSDALADDPEQADRKTAKAVNKLLRKFPSRGGGA